LHNKCREKNPLIEEEKPVLRLAEIEEIIIILRKTCFKIKASYQLAFPG
jgi:hypothetical protein